MKGVLDMQVKWFFFLIQVTGVIVLLLWFDSSFVAKAESVSSIRTEGSIGFYGTYEAESKPQPSPPDGVESIPSNEGINKPDIGKLPQLGSILSNYWLRIGLLLLAIYLLKRKQINQRVV